MAQPSIFNKLTFFNFSLNLFLIEQDFNVNQLRLTTTKKELHKSRTILNYYDTGNNCKLGQCVQWEVERGWGGGVGWWVVSASGKGVQNLMVL